MKLKAKTPNGAAKEFVRYLQKTYPDYEPNNIIAQKNLVIWDEGPFEWTMVCSGCCIFGPEMGIYSNSDKDWSEGISNDHVLAEAQNNWSIGFYKQ